MSPSNSKCMCYFQNESRFQFVMVRLLEITAILIAKWAKTKFTNHRVRTCMWCMHSWSCRAEDKQTIYTCLFSTGIWSNIHVFICQFQRRLLTILATHYLNYVILGRFKMKILTFEYHCLHQNTAGSIACRCLCIHYRGKRRLAFKLRYLW